MRVKIGELKAKLSSYLRQVRESGEPLEVCVREDPVAYLVPAGGPREVENTRDLDEIRRQLAARGLVLAAAASRAAKPANLCPRPAGDGRDDLSSVEVMREGRDW